jgi:hypothetical protein
MKYTYELDSLKRFKYLKAAEEGEQPTIEIPKENFRSIICGFHGLKSGKIIEIGFTTEEKQAKAKHDALHEKDEILKWLADNDWKVNKVVVGEWEATDPRWVEYLNERKAKRNRLDDINKVL